jgi:hypothetical protein
MKHDIASNDSLLNRNRIAKITNHAVSIQPFKIPQIAASPHQHSKLSPLRSQRSSHMAAHKTRSPCDESEHLELRRGG